MVRLPLLYLPAARLGAVYFEREAYARHGRAARNARGNMPSVAIFQIAAQSFTPSLCSAHMAADGLRMIGADGFAAFCVSPLDVGYTFLSACIWLYEFEKSFKM